MCEGLKRDHFCGMFFVNSHDSVKITIKQSKEEINK